MMLLQSYDFPGNARQLKAVMSDAVMKAQEGILTVADFKELFTSNSFEDTNSNDDDLAIPTIEDTFNTLIRKALAAAGGNQVKAATMLGISQSTLSRRLKKLKK